MDPQALKVWEDLVSNAYLDNHTYSQFYDVLKGIGRQHYLSPDFLADELVPHDLEPYISTVQGEKATVNLKDHNQPLSRLPLSSTNQSTTLKHQASSTISGRLILSVTPRSGMAKTQDLSSTLPQTKSEASLVTLSNTMAPSQIESATTKSLTIHAKPTTKRKTAEENTLGAGVIIQKRRIVGRAKPETATPIKEQTRLDKPECSARPPVWSNRRQELCETVPYYKSYEASWYHPQDIAQAMLISKDDSPRRHVDTNVIITRATGNMKEHPDKQGVMVTIGSHTDQNKTVRTVKEAFTNKRAVIIIASNKLDLLPVAMPHNFQVLDHFWVTDIWWEKVEGHHVFKYRFERCSLSKKPWYAPNDTDTAWQSDFSIVSTSRQCNKCNETTPQVYQTWVCLNHDCPAFWKLSNGQEFGELSLVFDQNFINKRSHFNGFREYAITPQPLVPTANQAIQHFFSRKGWLGFWCDQCGKCSSREDWTIWTCVCGNVRQANMPLLTAQQANVVFDIFDRPSPVPPKTLQSAIQPRQYNLGRYKVDEYEILPGQWIIHLKSNAEINAQPMAADELFKAMQEAKGIDLRRRINGPAHKDSPRAALTRHFSKNYGLHYDYVVVQGSAPFSEAPPAVCHALQQLIWAGESTKMDKCKPFNQTLVVGYMADGAMGFHDDGESTLGPTIATLSLGSSAVMEFRCKKKYWKVPLDAKKGAKFSQESIVLPGVPLAAERKKMQSWIQANPDATAEDQATHFRKMVKVKKYLAEKPRTFHTSLVKLVLNHGDMVIMHGADLQKYFEHQVEARGCLRFALTSRHVLPHLLDPSVLHMGDIDLRAYPPYNSNASRL